MMAAAHVGPRKSLSTCHSMALALWHGVNKMQAIQGQGSKKNMGEAWAKDEILQKIPGRIARRQSDESKQKSKNPAGGNAVRGELRARERVSFKAVPSVRGKAWEAGDKPWRQASRILVSEGRSKPATWSQTWIFPK